MDSLKKGKLNIIVTGGSGFIGSNLIIKLLNETNSKIFNIDKMGYASDLSGINAALSRIGNKSQNRYETLKGDISDKNFLGKAIKIAMPDIIFHLAAESHVDRSIDNPELFLKSNVIGTFNLLTLSKKYWEELDYKRKQTFRMIHVSTDEVFGSLEDKTTSIFNEETPYSPRSPYAASKAASDHFASCWFNTYKFPVLITNCSNNYGPFQFPEKLIPLVILKALSGEKIPVYGDGLNVRDWLYVDDHLDALFLVAEKGIIGSSYCIGGIGESTNINIVENICKYLDKYMKNKTKHSDLIEYVEDRPGHDRKYLINSSKIKDDLKWVPKFSLNCGLEKTINWYLNNLDWCKRMSEKANYFQKRIGINNHQEV